MHWKDWFWSWNSNTLATWCKEWTHWERPWCWERWEAGGGGDDRGWDGWMASPIQWTWVWASSGNWWWTGKPGMLQSMGSQRVRHNWGTELNWLLFNHRLEGTLGEFMRHQASTDAYTLLIDRSKEAKLSTHRWLVGFMRYSFLITVNIW